MRVELPGQADLVLRHYAKDLEDVIYRDMVVRSVRGMREHELAEVEVVTCGVVSQIPELRDEMGNVPT